MKQSSLVLSIFLYGSTQAIEYRPFTNGDTPWYKTPLKMQPDDFPVNYKVADFGTEQEIVASNASLNAAEKRLKKKLNATF